MFTTRTMEAVFEMSETKSPSLDPICGMAVDEESALHFVRNGKIFYFCSEQCLRAFTDHSVMKSHSHA